MANSYVRLDGLWRPVGGIVVDPEPNPDPDPPPAPASWQAAVDSRDYAQIEAWYAANTGHEALGLARSDLTPGSLESEFDGQVFEGIIGSHIRIGHKNVSYRGCRVENGAQYGAYWNPTFSATNVGNALIEYCTFEHNAALGGTQKLGILLFAGAITPPAALIRNCNLFGWPGTACRPGNGVTFEYSWVHDLRRFEGIHHNSVRSLGKDIVVRRNYLTDGSSGICSLYFDDGAMHRITVQENIMNGSSPSASPSYLINMKDGPYGPSATNIKILDNLWGDQYQYGIISSVNVPWNSAGNIRSGNRHFANDQPFGNS